MYTHEEGEIPLVLWKFYTYF